MSRPLIVERGPETGLAAYFRVSAGKRGGEMVTVRIGRDRVYACLTCRVTTCDHVRAVEQHESTASAAA